MSDSKKKRMSMLDTLAASSPPAPASMMSTNRALRSARDAVDGHRVWDLDPDQILDDRPADRFDPGDIQDLRHSIEANGQTVPILVRRDPRDPEKYRLVYGARRLAAVRESETVTKVRALIANLDDDAALRAQVSENTARRDLSFIERAVFAMQLADTNFGSQTEIAEVLNATKSSVSMAISIARSVGEALATTIGPAHGIGRPRWEALVADIAASGIGADELHKTARNVRLKAQMSEAEDAPDPSVVAFEAVARMAARAAARRLRPEQKPALKGRIVLVGGRRAARVRRMQTGLRIDLTPPDPGFADWLDDQAEALLNELHDRWKQQS